MHTIYIFLCLFKSVTTHAIRDTWRNYVIKMEHIPTAGSTVSYTLFPSCACSAVQE